MRGVEVPTFGRHAILAPSGSPVRRARSRRPRPLRSREPAPFQTGQVPPLVARAAREAGPPGSHDRGVFVPGADVADVACRACRVSLAADAPGCAVCAPVRPHLISTAEAEEDSVRPALSRVSDETLIFLRKRAKWYEKELNERPGAEHLDKGAIRNANALTKLLEAARRLQGDGLAAVANMSFAERAKLFVGWYASLPPAYRARMREHLERHETELLRPVAPTVAYLPPAEEP